MTRKTIVDQPTPKSVAEVETKLVGMFASIYSSAIDAMCRRYGPEALDVARQAFMDTIVGMTKAAPTRPEERDLHSYVVWLTSDVTEQGHRCETVECTETSIRLKYVSCPWVKAFQDVGHPEIGRFFCDADAPIASEFNPDIQFERTMTLMDGDDYCDHHFYTKADD